MILAKGTARFIKTEQKRKMNGAPAVNGLYMPEKGICLKSTRAGEKRWEAGQMRKHNSEGYSDLTAYGALSKIEKEEKAVCRTAAFRPLVYICSPYAGDIEKNTKNARRYSRFAVMKNAIPFAPHLLMPQYMDDKTERRLAMLMNSVFIGKCDELWVFGSNISNGMAYEIEKAEKMGKAIRYFTEDLKEAGRR